MKKPHIQRDRLFGWMCFGQESVGTGLSPLRAYRKWLISRTLNERFHAALLET